MKWKGARSMRKRVVIFVVVVVNDMKKAVSYANDRYKMDKKQDACCLLPFVRKRICLTRLKVGERCEQGSYKGCYYEAMSYLTYTFVYHIYFFASNEALESADIFPSWYLDGHFSNILSQ